MKKLFLTTAIILAAATSAHAVEAPSLGDRLKQNWNDNVTRQNWNAPVKDEPAFPAAADDRVKARDEGMAMGHKGKHHHKMTADQKAAKKSEVKADHKEKAAAITPEQKAKMKAERKAKWDAMTPEQKAAWKAKHAAKKAPAATPAPAAQ